MRKVRCPECKRLVSANGGSLSKHRVGRSRPGKVKDACKGSLRRLDAQAHVPVGKPKAPEQTVAQSAFAQATA